MHVGEKRGGACAWGYVCDRHDALACTRWWRGRTGGHRGEGAGVALKVERLRQGDIVDLPMSGRCGRH